MEHQNFADDFIMKLNSLKKSIHQGGTLSIDVNQPFCNSKKINIDGLVINYEIKGPGNPLNDLIRYALDCDQWKHSWHHTLEPENYKLFMKIIEDKIEQRLKQVEELTAIYHQLNFQVETLELNKTE